MSTDELLREREETGTSRSESETTSWRDRLSVNVTEMFSPRYFLVALVVFSVGLFVPSLIPFVPALVGLVGLFGAAFVLGSIGSEQRYLEIGAAGAVAGSVSILTQYVTIALFGSAMTELAAAGFGVGVLVSVLGYYFGRDLRAGLTRDIG